MIHSNESSQESFLPCLPPPIPATKICEEKITQQVDWQIASNFGSSRVRVRVRVRVFYMAYLDVCMG